MRTKIIFLLISSIIMFSSCEEEQEAVVIDTAIVMSFSDGAGNDLLDPDYAGSFDEEEIDVFYLKDGEKVRVYDAMMDSPENFFINQASDKRYYMSLFPNDYYGNGMLTTTYLQLSETDTDTVNCQMRKLSKNSPSITVDKVWYNGILVWDGQGPREFEIIK